MSIEFSQSNPSQVSEEQQSIFRHAVKRLLGVNAISFALSTFNEVVIGHSALGFTQATMELTDTALAGGLAFSHRNDVRGRHRRATRQRKALYGVHIATASLGIAEGVRLMHEGSEPSLGNMVVSGIVGALNLHYLHHKRKHRHHVAHTEKPNIEMAFEDPIEVVQDEIHKYPDADTIHQLNEDGTTAIAQTNLAEAAGGLIGSVAQLGWEQGSATAAIASSVAVVGIMARQIIREHNTVQLPQ